MSDLSRFYAPQERAYPQALREIRNGRKESHWIWYIFPQITGLGSSNTAVWYAIRDLQEAKDYASDPILGFRLREITQALLEQTNSNIFEVMDGIDAIKLCSCMTLFEIADSNQSVYANVLDRFFQGKRDAKTLRILGIQ